MDRTFLNDGHGKLRSLVGIRNKPEPREPRIRSHFTCRQYDDAYDMIKETFETNDHPLFIEAMFQAILESKNPMLIEGLKRTYMMAKLAIPADDPGLEEVRNHINAVNKNNREVDDDNEKEQQRYKSEVEYQTILLKDSTTRFDMWWDEYIDGVESSFRRLSESKATPSVWETITIRAFEDAEGKFHSPLRKGWWKRKNMSMDKFRTSYCREMIDVENAYETLLDFAGHVFYLKERYHKEFLDKEYQKEFAKQILRKAIVEERKTLEYDLADVRWHKRRTKRYMDDEWMFRQRYDSYGRYGYNDDYYRKEEEHAKELTDKLLARWDKILIKVDNYVRNIMAERSMDGVDGYDNIVGLPMPCAIWDGDSDKLSYNFEYDNA